MDKELAELHDLARARLLELREWHKANRKHPDYSESTLKRVRKALSNLDHAPELYGDIMSDASSSNFEPEQLTRDIRSVEEAVMRAFQLLKDDTIHHTVQQRTGGDSLAEVPGNVIRGAIRRLNDRGIYIGNTSGPGMNVNAEVSLSNYSHKSDDKATGLERKSGIGKNPDPTTTSHGKGTAGFAKDFTPEQLADEEALAKALEESAIAQRKLTQVGVNTDAPRQQLIRDLTGDPLAYGATATAEDVANTRKLLKNIPKEDIIDTYKPLKIVNGVARFNYDSGFVNAGLLDKVGSFFKNNWKGEAVGAGLSLLDKENRDNIKSGDYGAATRNVVKDAVTGGVVQAVGTQAMKLLPTMVGGAFKVLAPPVAAGAVAFQALDAIVDETTGRSIQETGEDAERLKEIRRQAGWSKHDLRRNARTGYKPPK